MDFHVLTLFPDMVRQGLENSIIGRAIEEGIIHLNIVEESIHYKGGTCIDCL